MTDLTKLDPQLCSEDATCLAIVETPKGSRSKYTYEPSFQGLKLAGLLPAGMSFPLDFGFIPSTLGEDGDPLDVLVLADVPSAPGCIVKVRLLGVIEAEQTENGNTVRNDRLVARTDLSIDYQGANELEELEPSFVEHLGRFFVQYNDLKGKKFEILGRGDSAKAVQLIAEKVHKASMTRGGAEA